MKSCLSLLAALLVMVLLAAAGYWAYQKTLRLGESERACAHSAFERHQPHSHECHGICPHRNHEARPFAGPLSTRPGKE